MKPARPLLIVGALSAEIRGITKRVDGGRFAGVPVAVHATGDGASHAGASLRRALARDDYGAVLGIGYAGGLDPTLDRGRIVVAEAVAGPDGVRHEADAAWSRKAAARLGAPRGLLLSAQALVPDAAAKAELLQARGPALTVDLESAAWASVAEEAGIPWLVLRIVFDAAADAIPEYLLDAADEEGRVDQRRIALGAIRHPSRIGELKRLGQAAARHAEALAEAVSRLLDPS